MKIISRKEARALGLKRYFTGEPCLHGHVAVRGTDNCTCCECVRGFKKIYRRSPQGKQWGRDYNRKYRQNVTSKSPIFREKNREYQRLWAFNKKHQALISELEREAKCLAVARRLAEKRERARKARWERKHREKLREANRIYKQKNKQKAREYYLSTREKTIKRSHDYYWNNREKIRAYTLNGPKNPKGARQWLKKAQALTRSVRRAARNQNLGV